MLSPMRLLTVALALGSLAAAPPAQAHVTAGETLEGMELATLAGGKEAVFTKTAANVVLFFRPGHERSADTLKQMAECEKVFAGKPVHMVAVVSGSFPAEEVKAAVSEAQLHVPVLVDAGDALYGKLEIRQHPLVLVADARGKVVAAQPYVRLRYCEIIRAHVRHLLKEIDDAQLEAALNPARASFPSDDKANVARRYVRMGKREAAAGDCEKALHSFGKALEIAPDNKEAQAGVEACKSNAAAKP